MKIITHNWQLKLVALFLAVALWLYTRGQVRIETVIPVVVAEETVSGLGSEHRISGITPREFAIEVSGPSSVLRNLRSEGLHPRLQISAQALEQGQQTFSLTSGVLGLDSEVRILRTNPDNIDGITVTLGRVVRKEFWLEPPTLEDVPVGVDPTLSLEESRVTVTGPEPVLRPLIEKGARIRFARVSLAGVDAAIAEPTTVRLALVPDLPDSVEMPPVHARVVLTPAEVDRLQIALNIGILAAPEWLTEHRVELGQPQVVLTVRGPRNLLASLKPEDVAAYVDLRQPIDPNRARDLPVQVHGPSWLAFDPATVRVVVGLAMTRGGEPPAVLDVGP